MASLSQFGLYGLAVMGQNFALNIAEHGFTISVCNRSASKVDDCVARAKKELGEKAANLQGFKDPKEFVQSLAKPRVVMFLVQVIFLFMYKQTGEFSSLTLSCNRLELLSINRLSYSRR